MLFPMGAGHSRNTGGPIAFTGSADEWIDNDFTLYITAAQLIADGVSAGDYILVALSDWDGWFFEPIGASIPLNTSDPLIYANSSWNGTSSVGGDYDDNSTEAGIAAGFANVASVADVTRATGSSGNPNPPSITWNNTYGGSTICVCVGIVSGSGTATAPTGYTLIETQIATGTLMMAYKALTGTSGTENPGTFGGPTGTWQAWTGVLYGETPF